MKHFKIIIIIVSIIMINSKDINLKALIIMRYCKNYSSIREGMQAAMSIETRYYKLLLLAGMGMITS